MSRPTGGYIGFNRVPAASAFSSAAIGVWTLREAEANLRAGTWPNTFVNPTSVNGLQLWLDFSDTSSITLSGSNISQINDKSGNGFHGSQSTDANRPGQATVNGLNCGDWGSGANSKGLRYQPGGTSNNWREVAIVGVWDGGGTTFPTYHGLFTGSDLTGTQDGVGLLGDIGTGNWYEINGPDPAYNSWATTVVLNGTTTTTAFNTIKTVFCVQFWRSSNLGVNGYMLGSDRSIASRGWRGKICEVVAYNVELDSGQRSALRTYLSDKWGIS